MSHTYAILNVPEQFYELVRAKLNAAGYLHAFVAADVIDMHGIALSPEEDVATPLGPLNLAQNQSDAAAWATVRAKLRALGLDDDLATAIRIIEHGGRQDHRG